MNIYRIEFQRECPNNGVTISYRLDIQTNHTVMVEDIVAAVIELPEKVFHEDAAAQLSHNLPGKHTLLAYHHGVTIITIRGRV